MFSCLILWRLFFCRDQLKRMSYSTAFEFVIALFNMYLSNCQV